jgi:steroid delta-isomerase-like uncharacterized protein
LPLAGFLTKEHQMSEQNKAVIRRLVDGFWNKKDVKVFDEVFAARFVDRTPMAGTEPTKEGFKAMVLGIQAAIPDARTTVDDLISEGDKVAWRWTFQGTQKGPLMGIPATGKRISFTGFTIDRIAGGQIVERWHQVDTMGLMQQLGVIPPPGQSGR